jgi:polyferredoxin
MIMSDLDALKCAIRDVLDERTKMPSEEHRDHHDWVRLQIEKQQARTEFWRALFAKSLPAIVWSALAAGATWAYHWIVTHVTWR